MSALDAAASTRCAPYLIGAGRGQGVIRRPVPHGPRRLGPRVRRGWIPARTRPVNASDLCLDEHPDRVERGGDVVIALGTVEGVEEEGEARAVAVRRDFHLPPVAARRAPLDAAPFAIRVKGRFAMLLAPVVPGVDLDAVVSAGTGRRHLGYERGRLLTSEIAAYTASGGAAMCSVCSCCTLWPPPKLVWRTLLRWKRCRARHRPFPATSGAALLALIAESQRFGSSTSNAPPRRANPCACARGGACEGELTASAIARSPKVDDEREGLVKPGWRGT
jgi:hypothetical protein